MNSEREAQMQTDRRSFNEVSVKRRIDADAAAVVPRPSSLLTAIDAHAGTDQ